MNLAGERDALLSVAFALACFVLALGLFIVAAELRAAWREWRAKRK